MSAISMMAVLIALTHTPAPKKTPELMKHATSKAVAGKKLHFSPVAAWEDPGGSRGQGIMPFARWLRWGRERFSSLHIMTLRHCDHALDAVLPCYASAYRAIVKWEAFGGVRGLKSPFPL